MKRQDGLYWVMILDAGEWVVGEWHGKVGAWVIKTNTDKNANTVYMDSNLAQVGHKIPNNEELHKKNKKEKNKLIDKILSMYVPDGNPQIWFEKIKELKIK